MKLCINNFETLLSFYTILYNIFFIPIAKILIFVTKFFNKKIKDREDNYLSSMQDIEFLNRSKPTILFHSSSMGEFEQAKPIIERLRKDDVPVNIVCSFYSPSGYNNQKDYEFADEVVYMPFDTRANAKKFLSRINPKLVIFVRYDIWHNHLLEINRRNCELWLIDATEPQSKLIKSFPFWGFTKYNYNFFDKIYTMTENDFLYFSSIGLKSNIIKSTDTRFDRIIEKVENAKSEEVLSKDIFDENDFILVAGSTWEPDEQLIINSIEKLELDNKKVIVVFVPHEPTAEHIDKLKRKLKNPILFSEIDENNLQAINNHIIVDKIGILLNLYSIADAAYIGGGFGTGVHSVTEAAGYSIPIACGSKMNNSPDAVNLQKKGALEVVQNDKELFNWLRSIILYDEQREKYGLISGTYVHKSKGSSFVIVNEIKKYFD